MQPRDTFSLLVQRYLDGTATADEVDQLDARLQSDPQARRDYVELLNLDSALAEAAALGPVDAVIADASLAEAPARSSLSWGWASRSLAFAAVFTLVSTGVWHGSKAEGSFAIVANDAGAAGLGHGTRVHRSPIHLTAGTVELITSRGARVVIEAPASFRFESAQRLHVAHGRVAAHVPPAAKGFTVITPTGSAIDLGTDFGVDVPRTGAAEIHVFNGEVIAKPSPGGTRRNLRDGEALALQPGAGSIREMRSAAFIRPEEMAGLSAALTAGQRVHSDAANASLLRDPALIALLDFESDEARAGTFRNVQGRWPGSRAPEFVQTGDRMTLDVGGDRAWPRFTLAAWVRIDRLGATYQSLYHTDGWSVSNRPGQVHWMITGDMTMRLALRGNTLPADADDRHGYPDSRTSVLPEQGRWMHLAVVYDADARTVRFYLNGKFDKEGRQEIALPARFGPAQIGNWDSKDRKLSGRVDELLILGRAMSDSEIAALFEAGNPYQ